MLTERSVIVFDMRLWAQDGFSCATVSNTKVALFTYLSSQSLSIHSHSHLDQVPYLATASISFLSTSRPPITLSLPPALRHCTCISAPASKIVPLGPGTGLGLPFRDTIIPVELDKQARLRSFTLRSSLICSKLSPVCPENSHV
jgi:hypothetical protein